MPSSFLRLGAVAVVAAALLNGAMRAHADTAPSHGAAPLVSEPAQVPEEAPAVRPFVPFPFPFPTPVPKPKPQKADARRLLSILANERACKTPLDLSVQNVSLEELAARVAKKLPRPAPRIEVQGALAVRLSFTLKNSTVGEALSAAGALAGVKLWVFEDHLLLAPATTLGKSEAGGEWAIGGGWNASDASSPNEIQRVFASLVAEELGAKAAATPNMASSKTTFGALSADSQKMLKILVDQMNEVVISHDAAHHSDLQHLQMDQIVISHGGAAHQINEMVTSHGAAQRSPLILKMSPDLVVEFDPTGSGATSNGQPVSLLQIKNANQTMEWATNGEMSGSRFMQPFSRPSNPALPPVVAHSKNNS